MSLCEFYVRPQEGQPQKLNLKCNAFDVVFCQNRASHNTKNLAGDPKFDDLEKNGGPLQGCREVGLWNWLCYSRRLEVHNLQIFEIVPFLSMRTESSFLELQVFLP